MEERHGISLHDLMGIHHCGKNPRFCHDVLNLTIPYAKAKAKLAGVSNFNIKMGDFVEARRILLIK